MFNLKRMDICVDPVKELISCSFYFDLIYKLFNRERTIKQQNIVTHNKKILFNTITQPKIENEY